MGEEPPSVHFVAAGCGGLAVSYATGMAAPVVVALWGVFVWHEVRGANPAATTYSAVAFLCYPPGPFVIAREYYVAA
jgi:glucose uptake protein